MKPIIELDNSKTPVHFTDPKIAMAIHLWAEHGVYGNKTEIVRECNLRHAKKRGQSKDRGIKFELTHDQHFTMLLTNYKGAPVFAQIGQGTENLCLQRKGDEGHYTIDNCHYGTTYNNIVDKEIWSELIGTGKDHLSTKWVYTLTHMDTGEVIELCGEADIISKGFSSTGVHEAVVNDKSYRGYEVTRRPVS